MSQLIALIIAIALGAIVTAIGFVFLGDAFTKNSERGVALQLVSQASQVEMAMTAHRAEKAKSAFTPGVIASNTQQEADWLATSTSLTGLNYLKDLVVAPQGKYSLVKDAASNVYLVASGQTSGGVAISANVCKEVEKLAGRSAPAPLVAADLADGGKVGTALGNNVYGCFVDSTATPTYAFAYEVE